MSLKAVLFDFNGVIINDESLHEKLIDQLLLEQNIRPSPGAYQQYALGRSDRVSILNLFASQERLLTEATLKKMLDRKTQLYQQTLTKQKDLPIFPDLIELLERLRTANLQLAVVSGAMTSEIEWVLQESNLRSYFSVIVGGDEILTSKPEPEGYLLAIARLNQTFPDLQLKPRNCLAIEDTPAGIQAAKAAGISVVGVAHTLPFRMMHRQANWVVDYLNDLDLEHIYWYFDRKGDL